MNEKLKFIYFSTRFFEKDKIVTTNVKTYIIKEFPIHASRQSSYERGAIFPRALDGIQMKANTRKHITREKK